MRSYGNGRPNSVFIKGLRLNELKKKYEKWDNTLDVIDR